MSASFGQPKREVATIPDTCVAGIDDEPTFACDPDHAVCDCKRTWHDRAAMKVLLCRIDLARSRTRGNSGDSRYCLECPQCGIRWLVWRTESATTFWPNQALQAPRPRAWPDDAVETSPVFTLIGLFVARRAILARTGRKMGKTTVCRRCHNAIAKTWPPVCRWGCHRSIAPGCVCGECELMTDDVGLCLPAWRLRKPTLTAHRARCIDELRGVS